MGNQSIQTMSNQSTKITVLVNGEKQSFKRRLSRSLSKISSG